MKKNFSDFARTQKDRATVNGDRTTDSKNDLFGGSENAFETVKRIAEKYEGASESDLLAAILSEAVKARAEGKLSDAEIDSFAEQISPMLTDVQRKRLAAVIGKIKKT